MVATEEVTDHKISSEKVSEKPLYRAKNCKENCSAQTKPRLDLVKLGKHCEQLVNTLKTLLNK